MEDPEPPQAPANYMEWDGSSALNPTCPQIFVKGLVPNAAVFRGGPVGGDWVTVMAS
jgi:hypothetical protein